MSAGENVSHSLPPTKLILMDFATPSILFLTSIWRILMLKVLELQFPYFFIEYNVAMDSVTYVVGKNLFIAYICLHFG